MSRKSPVLLLATVMLAAFAMVAPAATSAATTIKGSKSNADYKVTAVNAPAGTFTAVGKDGKPVTFAAPKGTALPTVGKFYDITYTASPGGGPAQATTIHGSKSNSDY